MDSPGDNLYTTTNPAPPPSQPALCLQPKLWRQLHTRLGQTGRVWQWPLFFVLIFPTFPTYSHQKP